MQFSKAFVALFALTASAQSASSVASDSSSATSTSSSASAVSSDANVASSAVSSDVNVASSSISGHESPELIHRVLPAHRQSIDAYQRTFEDGDRPEPPRYMLTSALDNTIKMWDVSTGDTNF